MRPRETVSITFADVMVATQPGNNMAFAVASTDGERGMRQMGAIFAPDVKNNFEYERVGSWRGGTIKKKGSL